MSFLQYYHAYDQDVSDHKNTRKIFYKQDTGKIKPIHDDGFNLQYEEMKLPSEFYVGAKARLAVFFQGIFGRYFEWRECPNIARLTA